MIRSVQNFLFDEDGATAIEYALLASLMALFVVNSLGRLGSRLGGEFSEVSVALK